MGSRTIDRESRRDGVRFGVVMEVFVGLRSGDFVNIRKDDN